MTIADRPCSSSPQRQVSQHRIEIDRIRSAHTLFLFLESVSLISTTQDHALIDAISLNGGRSGQRPGDGAQRLRDGTIQR